MILIPAINWISAFIFASFASVLFLGGKKASTRTYALVALCATGWVIGMGAYFYVDTPTWLVFWNRYNHVLAGLIAVAFYYYALLMPNKERIDRRIILSLFITEILFLFAYFYTDIIINDSALLLQDTLDRYQDLFYSVGPIFYLHFFGFFAAGFALLYKAGKRTTAPDQQKQLSYLFWGTLIGVIPPVTANIVLPRVGIYDLYAFGGVLTIGWVAFSSYAIARHQLFNVRLVLTSIAATSIMSIAGLLVVEIGSEHTTVFSTLGRGALFVSFLIIGAFLLYSLRRGEKRRIQLARLDRQLKLLNEELTVRVLERTQYLKHELEHSETILENLSDGLVELDSTFKIIRINPAAESLLNVSKDEVVGVTINPHDIGRPEKQNLARITFPGTPGQHVVYNTRSGMRAAVTEVTIGALHERELEVITITFGSITTGTGFIKILRDITAEKEVSRNKNAFITTAAHRLRTPLSNIKWTFEEFLEGGFGALNKKQTQTIFDANKSNNQMIRLVNNLLDSAHNEEGHFGFTFKTIDAIELLQMIIHNLLPKAQQRGITLSLKTKGDMPLLRLDRDNMQQAIENLIDNALNYTNEGGSVTVLVCVIDTNVVIQIVDTGIGVSKEDQQKLFTKFFRSRQAQKQHNEGSGLGLYIAKHIIGEHRGTLMVDSKEGEGSTFTVKLPIV
ncbi:MAG: ATP-binding protein [bacterium]|nr:ATP-binding protein [bacterium]